MADRPARLIDTVDADVGGTEMLAAADIDALG